MPGATCGYCGATLKENLECAICGPAPAAPPIPHPAQRRAAALAYLWITGLAFLFLKRFRQSGFVRFHSLQAVFFGLAVLALNTLLALISGLLDPFGSATLVYATVWGLVRLGWFLYWMLAWLKAYQGLEYELPVIGGLTRKYLPPS